LYYYCCLPYQDRTGQPIDAYLSLTSHSVEAVVTRLMESGSREDVRAVARMQAGMKSVTGQEFKSHRYSDSSNLESQRCVVGVCSPLQATSGLAAGGLRAAGGGLKEVLLVLAALHGVGADTVLLDSPGFSLHPPQQKALALWISKCLYENTQSASRSPQSPVSVVLITNSTEFITEDSLPCLYCFQRILQSCVKTYTFNEQLLLSPGPGGASVAPSTPSTIGVAVYDKPVTGARVLYVIPPSTQLRCRGRKNQFAELVVNILNYILIYIQ
jgi:hypothetical protein